MTVEQIMTRAVLSVGPETPIKDVARLLSEHHISGLPVRGADGSVLGVVSEADILRKEERSQPASRGRLGRLLRRADGTERKFAARTAGDAMTAPAVTARPTQSASDAASLMLARGVNRLPVVSAGRLVGIVTRADLVRAFHRSDAELEEEICEDVLVRMLWIEPGTIRVTVQDGVVDVVGTVETPTDVRLVKDFVRRVPGVVECRFDLRARVVDTPPDRSYAVIGR
jgi:CBS domain-containing protein